MEYTIVNMTEEEKLHHQNQRKASLELELCALRSEISQLTIENRGLRTHSNCLKEELLYSETRLNDWKYLLRRFFKIFFKRK